MDHPAHPWPAAVARHIAGDLAEVAGGRLIAVYLHGSAVLGGWVPGRSDVDVLVVVSDEIGDATLDSMAHAMAWASRKVMADEWPAPNLESSIVAAAAARRPAPPWPFFRHVVTDPAEPARIVRPDGGQGDRDLLMHYAVCRTVGYPVFGPPAREVIGGIARTDVLSYLADELSWGLANAPERYAVLNACRAALYLTDGTIVSKVGGGEAALVRRTGPADVITRALAQQRGTRPDQPLADDAIAFVEATIAMLRAGT